MSSHLKALYKTLCTGWLIEYPGRGGATPRDFFAEADPARPHPITRKRGRKWRRNRGNLETRESWWNTDKDEAKNVIAKFDL